MRVGLISDTHGLLRPAALDALAGVEHIVHAGDVGTPLVLPALGRIAPVTAVRGNVDRGPWAAALPEDAWLELDGTRILVRHIREEIDVDPAVAGIGVVITGHSHRPSILERGGVLWINPGSAGPRRFDLPVSLALLELGAGAPSARIVELEVARLP